VRVLFNNQTWYARQLLPSLQSKLGEPEKTTGFYLSFFSEINPYEFVKYALREQTISPYTTDFASFSNTA